MWLLVWVLGAPATAGTVAYRGCCEAAGAARCPSELLATGPGTEVGAHTTLTGLWRLECDGGPRFDPEASHVADRVPERPGTLLTPMPTAATRCWDAACALPTDLCVHFEGRASRVVRCADGQPPAPSQWSDPSTCDTVAVVVGAKVLRARLEGAGPSPATAHGPPRATPEPPRLVIDLPEAPTTACASPPSMRAASARSVEEGNVAAMQGDVQGAVDRYRAALTVDRCNPFAWADLGEALAAAGQVPAAREALRAATVLMPRHYAAWTNLGYLEEAAGQREAATHAYRQALRARPDHPPALAALRRLGAR